MALGMELGTALAAQCGICFFVLCMVLVLFDSHNKGITHESARSML